MKSPLHNSRLAGALFFSLNIALALSSCDTTEEGYHVGTVNDVYLTTDPATQLRIPADGQAQTINVLANVPWEVEAPERTFTVTTSSDRTGNGTITVSAGVNVSEAVSATLRIYARDFNLSTTIELVQAKMTFAMTLPEDGYPEAPEQGATYMTPFSSSIDWRFNVIEGSADWLTFTPAITGPGDWNVIEASIAWLPNYTTSPRSATLQLIPAEEAVLNYITLPDRFTLTQAAGTLPSDISVTLNGEADKTSASLTVAYKSAAPVDEVGVKVSGPTGERSFVAPLQSETAYPQSGSLTFTLDGLEEGTDYSLTPFVVSKVGESVGEPLAIRTYAEFVFDGPKLAANSIEPTATGVSALFDIESDIKLNAVEVKLLDRSDIVMAEQREAAPGKTVQLNWQQNVTLSQNTDYKFVVTAEYINPNNGRAETITLATLPFRTATHTPEEGDNKPIK